MPLSALYIDPDLTSRLRFKQAARTTGTLGGLVAINTLLEGLERLETRKVYDVVYLASKFTSEVLANFIKAARRTLQGTRAVYMIVLERQECDATTLASFALAGADGFLVSPFSTDSLTENLQIATRLISANTRKQQELSLELLVKAVTTNFSDFVTAQATKTGVSTARDHLHRTQTLISALPADILARYYEMLTQHMAKAIARPRIAQPAQGGFMPPRILVRVP